MLTKSYNVVSVMSGTSLDGIDLLYANYSYQNKWKFEILNAETDAIVRADAGTIYPTTGKIELKNLLIESSDVILIFADPNSNDIAPKYNQLVSIEQDETPGITVVGEEDTITTLGSAGTSHYTTFSRHE